MPAASPPPELLLVLLEVARTGTYSAAGAALGVNHTTVARKIAALEDALGDHVLVRTGERWALTPLGERVAAAAIEVQAALARLRPGDDVVSGVVRMTATDGFSAYLAAPAIARVRDEHPGVAVELVTATRRAMLQRSGVDIEVVVGEPRVFRAHSAHLGDYALGMYASRDYLARHGTPTTREEVTRHGLIYFIDSMLQVDDLDAPRRIAPDMEDGLTSTNVFVHVEATRAGAGIGFLPCFMADRHDDLVRLLGDELEERLPYYLVIRAEAMRQPAVALVVEAIKRQVEASAELLLGAHARSLLLSREGRANSPKDGAAASRGAPPPRRLADPDS